MTPSALIFDVDGTLTETAELHRAAFNTAFRDVGVDWHWSAAIFTHIAALPDDRTKLECYIDAYRPGEASALAASDIAARIVERKSRLYRRMAEDGVARLRPGVARLIREARNLRIPLAIASTSPREDFEHILQNHLEIDVASWFSAIISREDLSSPNDTTGAYAKAIAAMSIDPTLAIAFDDSGDGVAAARANRLSVIAVPGIYTSSDNFSDAMLVISDLGHPAAPFQVIRGEAGPFHFVSIDALNFWSRQQGSAVAA